MDTESRTYRRAESNSKGRYQGWFGRFVRQDVKVHIDGRLASSNADVMLDSTLESEEALKGYAVHPEHVAVANGKVRPYTVQRSCLDFEI